MGADRSVAQPPRSSPAKASGAKVADNPARSAPLKRANKEPVDPLEERPELMPQAQTREDCRRRG
jgi:hypothetical protein